MAKGPVEIWLLDLLKMQMSSLHNIIRSAFYQISDSGFQLLPFLNHFPAQVRLHNTQRVEIRGTDIQETVSLMVWKLFDVCWLLRHVQLSVTPWTVDCQAPLSMDCFRQEYWSGLPFPSPRKPFLL